MIMLQSLYKHCKKLEENKADKLYVQKEVDVVSASVVSSYS